MSIANKNLTKILSALTPDTMHLPILDVVKNRYTLGLWSHSLVDRCTLTGSVIHYLHTCSLTQFKRRFSSNKNTPDIRFPLVLRKALAQRTNVQLNSLHPTVQKSICDFLHEDRTVPLPPEYNTGHQLLKSLQHEDEPVVPIADPNHWSNDHSLSYLRDASNAPVKEMNVSVLNTLFGRATPQSLPTDECLYFSRFLPPQVQASLKKAITDGLSIERELQGYILKQSKESAQGSKLNPRVENPGINSDLNALKNLSQNTVEQIAKLNAGQSLFIFGGIPGRLPNLNQLNASPDPMVDTILGFLTRDHLHELSQKICQRIIPVLTSQGQGVFLQGGMANLKQLLREDIVAHLYPRLTKSLYDGRSRMGKMLVAPAEHLRRKAESYVRSVVEETTASITELLTSIFEEEADTEDAKENPLKELKDAFFNNRLEETIQRKLEVAVDKHLGKLRESFIIKINEITANVPPVLLEFLKGNNLVDLGAPDQPIWFEFTCVQEGSYSLNVYASGMAATLHPAVEQPDGTNRYRVPMLFPRLTLEHLNVQFFQRLFAFKALPKLHSYCKYQPTDVYSWLKGVLTFDPHHSTGHGVEANYVSNHWTIFQSVIDHHLNFPSLRERNLYYFNLRKLALLDFWTNVKGNLGQDSVAREALRTNVRKLSEEAAMLFNPNVPADLEILQRIYATRKEIYSALDAVETSVIPFRSEMIPPAVLPHLNALFAKVNSKGAETLKDLLIGALGPDVEAPIDEFIHHTFPKHDVVVPAPTMSGVDRFKQVVNVVMDITLGVSLEDFNAPTFFTGIRVALLVTRIVLSILFPEMALAINLAWVDSVVAYKILRGYVSRSFKPEIKAFHQWKRRKMAKMLATFLLGAEQLEHFNALVHSWHGMIVRSGNISFELSNQKPHVAPFSCALTTRTIRHLPTPGLLFKRKFPHQIRPAMQPTVEEINAKNALDSMHRWLSEKQKERDPDIISRYLNGQFKNLPCPFPGNEKDCWSDIANPRACLEVLGQLMLNLYLSTEKSEYRTFEHTQEVLVNLCKCYAIIDKLARRCANSHLEGFSANPWPLAFWPKNGIFRLADNHSMQDLRATFAYFGIDPDKIYTNREVEVLATASHSLFKQSTGLSLHTIFNDHSHEILILDNITVAGAPGETAYYQRLFDDPLVIKKLELHGIKKDAPVINKLLALYTDSPLPEDKRTNAATELYRDDDPIRMRILPVPYFFLRLANGLVHTGMEKLLNSLFEDTDYDLLQDNVRVVERNNAVRALLLGKEKSKERLRKVSDISKHKYTPLHYAKLHSPLTHDHAQKNALRPEGWPTDLWQKKLQHIKAFSRGHSDTFAFNDSAIRVFNHSLHRPPRTANEVFNQANTFTSVKTGKSDEYHYVQHALDGLPERKRQLLETLWGVPSDQVVRTLSFFSQNLDLLFSNDEMIFLMGTLLLSGDQLRKQIETEPSFAAKVGQFFARALSEDRIKKTPHLCLALIEIGILAQAEIEPYMKDNKEASEVFPSFRKILHGMLPNSKNNLIAGLLALPYYFVDPKTASKQVLAEGIYDIRTAIFEVDKDYPGVMRGLKAQDNELYNSFCHVIAGWIPYLGKIPANFIGNSVHDDQHIQQQVYDHLKQIYEVQPHGLVRRNNNYYLDSENICIRVANKQLTFTITHNDVTYYWVNPLNSRAEPHLTYWMASKNGSFELMILHKGKLKELRQLRVAPDELNPPHANEGWEKELQALHLELLPQTRTIKGEQATRVDLASAPHHLGCLTWFQPLSDIYAFQSQTHPDRMLRLEFPKVDLAFNIETRKGQQQAVSDGRFPDFYIAKQQRTDKLPCLQSHTRYLLLENDAGENIIVLPADSHYPAAISWFLKESKILSVSSSFGTMIDEMLNQMLQHTPMPQSTADAPTMYDYSIREGRLYSRDPMALLHLVLFSFAKESSLHGSVKSMDDTLYYLELFEVLGGRLGKRLPDSALAFIHRIEMMAPFSNNPELLSLSLRLSAIRIRNTTINIESGVNRTTAYAEEGFSILSTVLMLVTYRMSEASPTKFIDLRLNQFQKRTLKDEVEHFADKYLRSKFKNDAKTYAERLIQQLGRNVILTSFSMIADFDEEEGLKSKAELEKLLPLLSQVLAELSQSSSSSTDIPEMELNRLNLYATWETVPIRLEQMTDYNFCNFFHLYYRLARNKPPRNLNEQQKKDFHERALQFHSTLKCLPGQNFDKRLNQFVSTMRAAAEYPNSAFPNPDDFDDSISEVQNASTTLIGVQKNDYLLNKFLIVVDKRNEIYREIMRAGDKARLKKTDSIIPAHWRILPTLIRVAFKVKQIKPPAPTVKASNSQRPVAVLRPHVDEDPQLQEWLTTLHQEDQQYSRIFKVWLHNNFHVEGEHKRIEADAKQAGVQREGPFTSSSPDLQVQQGYQQSNTDLTAYYDLQDRRKHIDCKLKSREHLYFLRTQLEEAWGTMNTKIDKQKKQLIAHCQRRKVLPPNQEVRDLIADNKPAGYAGKDERLFLGLIKAFARQDERWIFAHTCLTREDLPQLQKSLFRLLLKMSRREQMIRSLAIVAKIMPLSLDDVNAQIHLKELIFELSRPRTYRLDGLSTGPDEERLSTKIIRQFLVIEHAKKIMFWEKQSKLFAKLFTLKYHQLIYQGQTGMGKTDVEKVLTSMHNADGVQTTYIFTPDALVDETSEQTSLNSYHVSDQRATTMQFTRDMPFEARNLREVLSVYEESIAMRYYLQGRRNDLLCIRALFIESAIDYRRTKSEHSRELYAYFARQYNFVRNNVRANLDEPQKLLCLKEELKHPTGNEQHLPPQYNDVMVACIQQLLENPILDRLVNLRANKQENVTKAIYDGKIRPVLAEFLSRNPDFVVPESLRIDVEKYLNGDTETLPKEIVEGPHYKEINAALGVLRDYLPEVLKERVFVGYGPSEQKSKKYAIPFSAKDIRNEKFTIKDPYEASLKTLAMYALTRLSWDEIVELVEHLKRSARDEMRHSNCPFEKTEAALAFSHWCKNEFNLADCVLSAKVPNARLTSLINSNNNAVLFYVREKVLETIPYHEQSIDGNASNFVSTVNGFDAGSATPEGPHPFGTHVEQDPGVAGEFIDYVCKTCKMPEEESKEEAEAVGLKRPAHAPKPIAVVPDNDSEGQLLTPTGLLNKLLTELFVPGSSMTTIIDGGALFFNLSNLQVAQMMMEFVKTKPHLNHIKGIVYISNSHEKMILERETLQSCALKKSTIKIEDCLVYIDDDHTTGLDLVLPVGVGAAVTMSKEMTFSKWAQTCNRLRGLRAKDQFLVMFMTQSVAQLIGDGSFPYIRKIVDFTIKNQYAGQADKNYISAVRDLANVIQSAALDTMSENPDDIDVGVELITRFESFLLQRHETDPTKLFARRIVHRPTTLVLESMRKEYSALITNCKHFKHKSDNLLGILNGIGKDRALPDTVTVYESPEKLEPHMSSFGFLQQVFSAISQAMTQDQQQVGIQEQQQHVTLQQHLNLQQSSLRCRNPKSPLRAKGSEWDPNIDYFASLDWLQLRLPGTKVDHSKVQCFNVRETLANAEDSDTVAVSRAFMGNLWWTNNFIGIQDKVIAGMAEPLSKQSKPVFELLITHETDAQGRVKITMGAIDPQEAEFWRKKMKENAKGNGKSNPQLKIGLFDLALNAVVATGRNRLRNEDLLTQLPILMDLARWKFLAGQASITLKEEGSAKLDEGLMRLFKAWIDSNKPDLMKSLYRDILMNQQIGTTIDSDLEFLTIKRKRRDPLLAIL